MGIRNRVRMFLGLSDPKPDPLVRGTDPAPDPSLKRMYIRIRIQ